MSPRWQRRVVAGFGVALAAFVLVACANSPPGPPGSFYLEATITVVDDRDNAPYAETVTELRWWSESVDRWRWELSQSGADEFLIEDSFSLSDGETVWFYDSEDNRYQRTVPFDLPSEFIAVPFPAVVLFGPANHVDLDDLAADYLSRAPDVEVFVGGTDRVLDTDVTLLDYRPTWRSGGGDEAASGGVGRMWVDEERMFVLRHEIDGQSNRQYVLVEVARVDYEPEFDEELFRFVAPDGAVERAPS